MDARAPQAPGSFSRGGPLRGLVYDAVCTAVNGRGLREWRRTLVHGLAGDVVEIGGGTGLNLPHYGAGARVVASDADPVMLARARPQAAASLAAVRLVVADAQALPLRDACADAAVVGLMLCSVPDPERVLAEVRRVLRPGGVVRFMEHVRAPDGTLRARLQDALNPAWRAVSGGCNANRRSVEAIRAAGFDVRWTHELGVGLPHLRPIVVGEADAEGR
ncbi:MAG TPA: class I SAM-dependent methyltransferase [Actinomycetota bacterium]|nr:class I SAM-dependent methyltransferase [Actinomycetota bacterium]